jgi:hypothetical protein
VLLTFVHAGAPQLGTGSLGSFEAWERLVRQCVVWLINEGLTPAPMADPADVVRLSRAEDPALARHAALLTAWHDLYGQAPVKVREVAALVNRGATQTWNNEQDARAAALVEAARDAAEIRGTFNARSFGWYLRRLEGVVVDGLRVDQVSRNERNITWTVTRVDELADA